MTDKLGAGANRKDYIDLLLAEVERAESLSREKLRDSMLSLERSMCDKFRLLREERGWSQSELSEKLAGYGFDLHQTTIAKLETGKRPLRVAEMYALSHVFRMPPGAVFFMTSHTREISTLENLGEMIAEIDERMAQMQQMMIENVDQAIKATGDMQTERNSLVDLMRRLSAERIENKQHDSAEWVGSIHVEHQKTT